MKSMRYVAAITMVLTMASAAQAMSVTNLDRVPHTVVYEVAGAAHREELAPNETVRFEGAPNGRLSLVSSPAPKHGGALNADGLLSGIIGNGRDQQIPVDAIDQYTIWPGGKLQLQRRMKRYGSY